MKEYRVAIEIQAKPEEVFHRQRVSGASKLRP